MSVLIVGPSPKCENMTKTMPVMNIKICKRDDHDYHDRAEFMNNKLYHTFCVTDYGCISDYVEYVNDATMIVTLFSGSGIY